MWICSVGIIFTAETAVCYPRPIVTFQVYLELSVEVAKSWRESKKELEKYGYFDAMYT